MRAWRDLQGQERVWHTRDAILLCVGHGSGNEKLVRTAARWRPNLAASGMRCMSKRRSCTRCPKTSAARS
jgi:K+-sensing histidine kinase KdpD